MNYALPMVPFQNAGMHSDVFNTQVFEGSSRQLTTTKVASKRPKFLEGKKQARRLEENAAVQLLVEVGASACVIQNKAQAIYKQSVAEGNKKKRLIPIDK